MIPQPQQSNRTDPLFPYTKLFRSDLHVAFDVGDWLGAGERVGAVDVHGAGAAHTFTAGAPEGEGRVRLVLDLDQRVQNHRRAAVEIDFVGIHPRVFTRSEEHTSELQSLMRISYAVFCLKKKK